MTDDLVKRLNEDFSVNAREDIRHQMHVYEVERKEAADRIEQLEAALQRIADEAFSPQDDDVIWMDDDTPLGQFIDKELQCAALAGEKKDD